MSQPAFALDPNGGSSSSGGRPRLTVTKKDRHGSNKHQSQHQSHREIVNEQGTKERVRISLKDRQPVHQPAMLLASAFEDDHVSAQPIDLSALPQATESRRRVVEVRQRDRREQEKQERRRGKNPYNSNQQSSSSSSSFASSGPSQASGFNTQNGSRRAMIVLPKSQEKMEAREKLMQMHPHIAQVFRGLNPPDQFQQEPFSRILTAEAPTLEYRRRNKDIKSVIQWGERKLFCLELEFLTQYAIRPNTVVVYAGVLPATRIPFLASLFPQVQFCLVDPTPLDFEETGITNVTVRKEEFSDAIAREIQAAAVAQGKSILFIPYATHESTTGFIGSEDEQYAEQHAFTKESMENQSRWHTILNPVKSLLKFSLPWTNDPASTYYLDGDIILPIWNPPTSTETRLVPNTYHRTWSHRHYEEQMFYFNTVTRVSLHEHGVAAEGLDGCYDCTAEVYVLQRYLERYPQMLTTAVGSQLSVVPAPNPPATELKLDNTKFKDPEWIAKQESKKAKFLITLVNDNAGQPLTADQLTAASTAFEQQQKQDAEMTDSTDSNTPAAAAASSSSSMDIAAAGFPVAPASADSMSDAAPSEPLSAQAQLALNTGKFSQELSRRLTHGGLRTLETLNEKVIKKAAFSRKNRA